MRTQTIDPTSHAQGYSAPIEAVPITTAPPKVAAAKQGRTDKSERYASRLWRATRNRILLSIPIAMLMMACFYMGFGWLKQANIPGLPGDGVRLYGFPVVLALAWASVSRLETIIRSMIGEEHFEC